MKKLTPRQAIALCIPLIMLVATYLFSSQTSAQSDDVSLSMSRSLLLGFRPMIRYIKETSETQLIFALNVYLRKAAHMFIYFLLGLSLYHAFAQFIAKTRYVFLFAVLASFLAACTDEFHQFFVEGRGAQWQDVAIDMTGVCIGLIFILLFHAFKRWILWREKNRTALLNPQANAENDVPKRTGQSDLQDYTNTLK